MILRRLRPLMWLAIMGAALMPLSASSAEKFNGRGNIVSTIFTSAGAGADMPFQNATGEVWQMSIFLRQSNGLYALRIPQNVMSAFEDAHGNFKLGPIYTIEGTKISGAPVNLRPDGFRGAILVSHMGLAGKQPRKQTNDDRAKEATDILNRLKAMVSGDFTNINKADAVGDFPIHKIAEQKDHKLMFLALRVGANPNVVDANGKTALLRAVSNVKLDIDDQTFRDLERTVHLLLEAGADSRTSDKAGNVPFNAPVVRKTSLRGLIADYIMRRQ